MTDTQTQIVHDIDRRHYRAHVDALERQGESDVQIVHEEIDESQPSEVTQ